MLTITTLRKRFYTLLRGPLILKSGAIAALIIVSGCSDLNGIDLSALAELSDGLVNSTPTSPDLPVSAARAEYDAKCSTCHGADGRGTAFYPQAIAPGSCGKVNCSDVNDLMNYIQQTMPSAGTCMADCASSTASVVTAFNTTLGNTNAAGGDAHFQGQCVRCHGQEGEGIPSLGTVEIGPGVCVSVDCSDTAALTSYIETSMPPDLPRLCIADCAVETALFVSTIELSEIDNSVAVPDPSTVDAPPPVIQATPFTNEDLMAMESVVITAVITADNTTYFSDIGNTNTTTAASVSDPSNMPTGAMMTADSLLSVKAGQKLNVCNHSSSTGRFRAHGSNRAGFAHWGRAQQLDPGQCNMGLGFPEVILPNAIGEQPGGLYNHNQGEDEATIFINVLE
ncbi:MAG: hypothetical protein P8104_04350 [Gammaproteobacteria bacterium]